MSEVEVSDGITFVGGVAAEQSTEGESSIPDDDRSRAIEAVREALKAEGETAAKQAKEVLEKDPLVPKAPVRGDDGKFKKQDDEAPAPEVKTAKPVDDSADEENLKRVLRERKQAAAIKAQQAQEYERQQNQLRQYHAQIQAKEREIAAREARLQKLRTDPATAIRENGWDPETFILDLAQEGTPEGMARRQQRQLEAQLKEIQDWKDSQARAAQEAQEAAQREASTQYRQKVENEYLGIAMDEERFPLIATLYKGNEAGLIAQGDVIAEQYRNMTGKEASFSDIAEYLEERHATWYKSRVGTGAQAAPKQLTQGRPTQGNATGRTLSPNDGSERRALGARIVDLEGDERREAAMEAVRFAIHASGERQ